MNIMQCDRCGNQQKNGDDKGWERMEHGDRVGFAWSMDNKKVDLCPDCVKDLKKFMKEVKRKKSFGPLGLGGFE